MTAGPAIAPLRPLAGGRLLSEITNRIVALMREHYGRGPIKAKTYVLDNLIVCVLSDGFTAIERTMMEGGEPERVLEMRRDFQRMMKARYSEMVEELTGRKVLAFLSQAHVEPDLTIEMFLMDGPGTGFGALELVDPSPSNPGNDEQPTARPSRQNPCSAAAGFLAGRGRSRAHPGHPPSSRRVRSAESTPSPRIAMPIEELIVVVQGRWFSDTGQREGLRS